ncbi:MAG: maleylpyruvate isomerase family mycothiol-dependent enzyme [Ilumatobacteraceae bacterium]
MDDLIDYVAALAAEGGRVVGAVRGADLDAAVPSCPGWTVRHLAEHLGGIHRWARRAAATGTRPDPALDDAPPDGDAVVLAEWLQAGVDHLVEALAGLDPAAPTWHPFPAAQVGAVWRRRQAHETAIHRWDIESVGGTPTPFDVALAADGVAEYYELIVPRLVVRYRIKTPSSSLSLHLVDADVTLCVSSPDGASVAVTSDAGAADHILAAPASEVLLALWGRTPPPRASGPWLALGGN